MPDPNPHAPNPHDPRHSRFGPPVSPGQSTAGGPGQRQQPGQWGGRATPGRPGDHTSVPATGGHTNAFGGYFAPPTAPNVFNADNPGRAGAALDYGGRHRFGGMSEGVKYYEDAFGDQVSAIGDAFRDAENTAQGYFGAARNDMGRALSGGMRAHEEGYGRGMGALGAGHAAAQGVLNPLVQQDRGARGAYADALMRDDNAMWQRFSDQRANNINRRLAAQGMLGSSGGRNALIESETQLQNMREQQFFDRARGLFNNAAGASANAAMGYGATGAEMGMGYGRGMADTFGRYGSDAANFGRGVGSDFLGFGAREGEAMGRAHGDKARFGGDTIRDAYFGAADAATAVGGFRGQPKEPETDWAQAFFDMMPRFGINVGG